MNAVAATRLERSVRLARAAGLVAAAAAAFAPAAQAAPGHYDPPAPQTPTIDLVRASVVGTKLRVTVDATLGRRGTVRISGTANGRRIRAQKTLAAGGDSVPVLLDPRRAGLRRLNRPVDFELAASVKQTGAARVTTPLAARIGMPTLVLPGLANEQSPGGFDLFAQALENTSGGAYGLGGKAPLLVVHEYPSLTGTLPELAKGLDGAARKLLRGSVFKKVDVVGYSMGGLVARKWMAGAGHGKVRKLALVGTPNEGATVAYIARLAAKTGALDTLIEQAGGGALTGALGTFFNDETLDALANFTPTYKWATHTLFGSPAEVDMTLLETFLLPGGSGTTGTPPLVALNAVPPDAAADIHAFYYSSVATEAFGVPVGTVDKVDITPIFASLFTGGTPDFSGVDLADLANGSGDGIVPVHSVTMDEVPAWKSRITKHDLGAGTHVTFTLDPQVFIALSAVLAQ